MVYLHLKCFDLISIVEDLPMADELRRGAETSRSESEFRIALDRYLEIITKLDGIDSPDIFLLGFGLDCYKSAIYLQVNFCMTCILD